MASDGWQSSVGALNTDSYNIFSSNFRSVKLLKSMNIRFTEIFTNKIVAGQYGLREARFGTYPNNDFFRYNGHFGQIEASVALSFSRSFDLYI